MTITARIRDRALPGQQGWIGAPTFRARSRESGFRTAAKKLGLRGRILTIERVGSDEWAVNVNGTTMMVVVVRGSR